MKRLFKAFCMLALSFGTLLQAATLQEVINNKQAWPKEVKVNVALKAPIVVGGRVAGSVQLPAGRVYPVAKITSEAVFVRHGNNELEAAFKDTDLFERAGIQEAEGATPSSPSPDTAAAPAATPAAVDPPASQGNAPPPGPASPVVLPDFTPEPEPEIVNMPRPQAPNNFAGQLFSNAIILEDGELKPYTDTAFLEAENFLVLYSGWWNLPSRGMTSLVQSLDAKLRQNQSRYRIVIASLDRNNNALLEHLQEGEIEWPTVPPGQLPSTPLATAKPEYLPGLVLFSADGSVVAQSYDGKEFLGHAPVMDALESAVK